MAYGKKSRKRKSTPRKKMKRRFKASIRRPKYDTSYKVTCDVTTAIVSKDLNATYPGGAPAVAATYPSASSWITVEVFHSKVYAYANDLWNADKIGIAATKEFGDYSPGFGFYRVNGVKMTFYPVEAEITNFNASYLGGYSFSSVKDAADVSGTGWDRNGVQRASDYRILGGQVAQGRYAFKRYYDEKKI